ncbi:MAG: tetratricopeptide repeat protein [Polyangiaceae bacterium]|nr:tetratricopeptide repeat protein [Polyangiaceae bacterium]
MRATLAVLLLAAPALPALGGCNPPTPRDPSVVALEERLGAAGFAFEDPMALDAATREQVRRAVGTSGAPVARLKRLDGWLRNGRGAFAYDPDPYQNAQRAYDERRGDCLAYALLFGSLARVLEVPTRFLHATEVLARGERDGWFYASSHVAVGLGTGPRMAVFDFTSGRITSSELTPFELVGDATVLALRYSNIAVDWMAHGRLAEAERLLGVLAELAPGVPEPLNNLGVARTRAGRPAEALALLELGLARFPSYPPLYTNAIRAAGAAGAPEVAHAIELAGSDVAERDPSFLFARGLRLYRSQSYGAAAVDFERATAVSPKSPDLHAWRARAYLSAGDLDLGRDAFETTRRLAGAAALVRELERQFPVLGAP